MPTPRRGLLTMQPSAPGLNLSLYTCEGDPILNADLLLDEVARLADGQCVRASLHSRRWLCGPRSLELRTDNEWLQVQGGFDEYGRAPQLRLRIDADPRTSAPSLRSLLTSGRASVHVLLQVEFREKEFDAA